ncbi:hypothetical protein FJZ53_06565 [Candidatus Woesearchaeota archaeon]|nr:hypothetical protein [Candidatus Woesearchaeota archaeon]
MKTETKGGLITLIAVVGIYAAAFGIIGGCNRYWNNKEIKKPGVHAVTNATGLLGHREYIRFDDGSEEVKVYHGLGHRSAKSYTYYNTDGNDTVDRIRIQGSALSHNRLIDMLVRETDYQDNKEEFDKADKMLLEERARVCY